MKIAQTWPLFFAFTMSAAWCPASAEVTLHRLFSDHAVLQREAPIEVWGTATAQERVRVELAGAAVETAADGDGRWRVQLPAMPAGGPYRLTAAGSAHTLEVQDVLIGEVWVASGQSNMHMWVQPNRPWSAGVLNFEQEIAAAHHPSLRVFDVERAFAPQPARDVSGAWLPTTPQAVGTFPATAYFFARSLRQELGVPIGIISASVGGTATNAWTSRQVLLADPKFRLKVLQYDKRVAAFPAALEAYEASKPADAKLNDPNRPRDPDQSIGSPSLLFNGMIAPVMPYSIRGVIWYQGESNARWPESYARAMRLLIDDWRQRWGQGVFPFLFVQLANHDPVVDQPHDSYWARLREQQVRTLDVPNTGMAVAIDVGAADTVHPRNKQAVGQRLARVALAKVYGRDVAYSGPRFKDVTIEPGGIRLTFDHVDGELKADGSLTGFAIAGADREFVWADARIDGETVWVTSPAVPEPVAVRYAWAENPVANLTDASGLPAVPFRTDDWPSVKGQIR
jgi:sialate O-acetylesterase